MEVFDSDKIGKDKSLGTVEISPRDLDSNEPNYRMPFPVGIRSLKPEVTILKSNIIKNY